MAPTSGFRTFVILWCGQFVSLVGTFLTAFALGVYVYQLTGSVTTLGFVYALSFLPLILVSPIAGSLVDRWGNKRALLVSNVGSMLISLVLAGLLFTHTFKVWHVFVVVAAESVLSALQMPAFESSVPLLVPKRHIGRANGMRLVATATSQVLAPVTAGVLLLVIHIQGIVLMDCLSFGFAVLTLLFIRIPRAQHEDEVKVGGSPTLVEDFREAWRYVVALPGLLALMVFLGAISFAIGFVDVLITPLVLAFASTDALGAVLSIGGVGMVATSVAMSAWGGPRRRVRGMLGFSLLLAAAIVMGSLRPSVPLIAVAAFIFLGCAAIIVGSSQSIWQTKVEPRLLGRVLALKNMIALAPQLIGYALAGVIADRVFQPLVGRDHVRSRVVAMLVGDGPGRGIALLVMLTGILIALLVVLAYMYPRLHNLEDELPDMIAEDELPDAIAVDELPDAIPEVTGTVDPAAVRL